MNLQDGLGRITFLLIGLLTMTLPCAGQSAGDDEQLLAKARDIHRRVIVLDSHVDIPGTGYATAELDPGVDHPKLQCDLVKMNRGQVDGVFLAVYVGQRKRNADGYRHALETALAKFAAIRRLTETMYPDRCELATSPDDVRRIAKTDRRAIMIGVENGYPIGTDLANLRKFYELGARYVTLSHNGHNQICDSCNPRARLGDSQSEHDGLSPFGEQVVAEMNRLGMMIDVSHVARSTFWDLIELSKAPIIASHCGCRALNDHSRNLDDRQIKALARHGGVIQIVALGSFLKSPSPERLRMLGEAAAKVGLPMGRHGANYSNATEQQGEQYWRAVQEINRRHPPAKLTDFVDHIDHAVKIAGIDHVGIGSDFDGGAGIPGFNSHAEAQNVTVELLRRGYTEPQIKKIWGDNLLRVWQDVEKAATKLK